MLRTEALKSLEYNLLNTKNAVEYSFLTFLIKKWQPASEDTITEAKQLMSVANATNNIHYFNLLKECLLKNGDALPINYMDMTLDTCVEYVKKELLASYIKLINTYEE